MRGRTLPGQVAVFFRHGSNLAILATLLGALGTVAWRHDPGRLWPFMGLGLALFPFIEYAVHRWILHARPVGSGWFYRMQRRTHYDHHQEPDRIDLLFTPLFLFGPLLVAHALLFFAVSRSEGVTLALMAGSMLGYLYYEWVHYVAHLPGAPATAWGRWMKKVHRWHHYKNEHYWFGVTTPLVDWLMGTYRRVEEVQKSSTTRQLYEAPRR